MPYCLLKSSYKLKVLPDGLLPLVMMYIRINDTATQHLHRLQMIAEH